MHQLKQSLSYLNDLENIKVFEDKKNVLDPNVTLIPTRVQSRHSNAKTYNTYVTYKSNNNSLDAIDSWFCTCKSGKRTVGCCWHVATKIYKLSLGKNQNSAKMAKLLAKISISFSPKHPVWGGCKVKASLPKFMSILQNNIIYQYINQY